jgi:plasmid replication initiation protein
MNHTYSTSDIACFLGTDRQNVTLYISKGYLKAIMVNGEYEITNKDYISFKEEYYDSGRRNSSRGARGKLTHQQIELLALVISDLQNDLISLNEFTRTYKNKNDLIPQMQDYILYKRDMCINFDNKKKGYRHKRLADKYGLSIGSIQQIVNQDKKST